MSSCANSSECSVSHYSFTWAIDFERRNISGKARLTINHQVECTQVVLDSHEGIHVSGVTMDGGVALDYRVDDFCSFGKSLVIALPSLGKRARAEEHLMIEILYSTSGEPAVTWLTPAQTLGNAAPMCFSMGQACLNRALFPCQDTPSVRATFDATFEVKPIAGVEAGSMAVACAAAAVDTSDAPAGHFSFDMKQSLPTYLIGAFVIGRIGRKDVGPRSAVWAEPELLSAAAAEFDGVVEKYLQAGESLFGPYRWERYDVIMMPKAFAYGGMENPRLTFLSPTLVVGDRSLTDTVAHEIAHSWFGNLVTNASWSQFFLNEGFTMYAQRRITDLVHGPEFTALEALVGWRLLEQEIKDQGGTGPFTKLNVPIEYDVDPDDTYNDVPYEKGYALLMYIRDVVLGGGSDALDGWLKAYTSDFAFSCVRADQMLDHLRAYFASREGEPLRASTGGKLSNELVLEWLDGEGMPPLGYAPDQSAALKLTKPAEVLHAAVIAAADPAVFHAQGSALMAACEAFRSWPTYQQSFALDRLIEGDPFVGGASAVLAFGTAIGVHDPPSTNRELSMRWAILVCKEGVLEGMDDVRDHLAGTGKQKFTLPVYRALAKAQPRHLCDEFAAETFKSCRSFLDVHVAKKVEAILAAPISEAAPPKGVKAGAGWANLGRGMCIGCPKC